MKNRSLLAVLATMLVTTLLATLVATFSSGSAHAAHDLAPRAGAPLARTVKPSEDFPRMPRHCATPKEKIPSTPVVCELNGFDRTRPSVVLWGDSHAWMFIPALRKAVEGRDVNLLAVVMGSCPPMDNQVRPTAAAPGCYRSNALGIQLARRLEASGRPYRIVLNGSWQRYVHARKVGDRTSYVGEMAQAMREGTPRLARTLRAIGSDVDVIGQVATVPDRHRDCAKGNLPYNCQLPVRRALPEYTATARYVVSALRPVIVRPFINVDPVFCTREVCKGKIDGIHTWFDDLHLSATRSATLARYFIPVVDAVSPPATPTQPASDPCQLIVFC